MSKYYSKHFINPEFFNRFVEKHSNYKFISMCSHPSGFIVVFEVKDETK